MAPRRGGEKVPQQRHRSRKFRMSVIALLALSVIAPLVFLAGRASKFSAALAAGRNDFLDWHFPMNNSESLPSFRGIRQIQKFLPEEVFNVFSSKDKDNEQLNWNIPGKEYFSSSLVTEKALDTERNVATKPQNVADMQQEQDLEGYKSVNEGSRNQNRAIDDNGSKFEHGNISTIEIHGTASQLQTGIHGDQADLLSLPPVKKIPEDKPQTKEVTVDAATDIVAKPQVTQRARHVSARQIRKVKKSASRRGNGFIRQVKSSSEDRHLPSKQEQNGSGDYQVKRMRDLLIKAKTYAAIAQAHKNSKLLRDLRFVVKDCQDALGDATSDSQLPTSVLERYKLMEYIMTKADSQLQYNCTETVEKMKSLLHTEEETSRNLRKESLFLSQLAAKTIPKGIHCLSMRLTVEYYLLESHEQKSPTPEILEDPSLYHYALFSDNVLAAGVVVNSTVFNAREPEKHVFHIVTDQLNYGAMRMWFFKNPPGKAVVHVESVETFKWLNSSYSPVLRQLESAAMRNFYFKANQPEHLASGLKFRNPKYLSMLNHLRFYLPHIHPKLDKILFLDDDIVVQQDLTPLWSIHMNGKINAAVETCGESFHRFDKYLNFSNPLISKQFDRNACGWAYGMNLFDLQQWKKMDITSIYHKWQEKNEDRTLWKLGTLPAGLLTFYNLTLPLEKHWHVLGLGYSPLVSPEEIESAAVIHYNGNMKPWLEIGMEKYKPYWRRYVKLDEPFLQQCNVNL